jgi:hypothetical protein
MPDLLVRSFTPLLFAFQPCFTQPSFSSFQALICAWILCSGRRSLTRVIQSAQLDRFKHFCAFHRFFSQARWNLDQLGHCVFRLLLPFCPEILIGAVDDTLARKSGRHIWGAGMHHDPLRSTQKRPVFSFGHSWVVLSLHVSFPFAPGKVWALPILVRLYRKRKTPKLASGRNGKAEKKQTGEATDREYRTRPQLASEMIGVVARWLGSRKLRVLGDSEYAGGSISRHLPAHVELISRMTMNAALYELPPLQTAGRGRRRKKGARLSNPLQMAQDSNCSWIKTTVYLYGHNVKVWYRSIDALWYSSAGSRLLRIVVVHDPGGRRRDDCFFSTISVSNLHRYSKPLLCAGPWRSASTMSNSFWALKTHKTASSWPPAEPLPSSSISMTWSCCGTHSREISLCRTQLSRGPGTNAKHRCRSKIFFGICGKPPGRKRFSATPDWMRTRVKSFNPLQSGSKLLHKCAKP